MLLFLHQTSVASVSFKLFILHFLFLNADLFLCCVVVVVFFMK